jgi:formylmethanofuran dehydrogenase subunit E
MAAKISVKKEKGKAVLTSKVCRKCGELMMSDKVQTVFSIVFTGAKRSSVFEERHKGCD